ncbi:MAG: ATP synthase F1 subunit delta [Nitrospirae bacterium]|nr:ATP synthase F1 subunit delta [Nitrospirota bacterium]
MKETRIAKKYGRVFVDTVSIKDAPKVLKELNAFSGLLDAYKKLKLLFVSPIFSEQERKLIIKELCPLLKASADTEKFLMRIVAQEHIAIIKEIIKAATTMHNEKLRKVKALVISPVALNGNSTVRLRDALKTITQRDVEMELNIDPSLIGGFIVKIESTIYDSSIKGQLRLLRAELTR